MHGLVQIHCLCENEHKKGASSHLNAIKRIYSMCFLIKQVLPPTTEDIASHQADILQNQVAADINVTLGENNDPFTPFKRVFTLFATLSLGLFRGWFTLFVDLGAKVSCC